MAERPLRPDQTHYIDIESGKAVGIDEYAKRSREKSSGDGSESSSEREQESDPAIAGIEAELERSAQALRDAIGRLESARRSVKEGAVTVYPLPGESGADAAKRMALEFAAKIGPLEDRVKDLRSSMEGLQAGLDAMKKARGQQ